MVCASLHWEAVLSVFTHFFLHPSGEDVGHELHGQRNADSERRRALSDPVQ